jgi:uncharacterized protein (DUF305 family)
VKHFPQQAILAALLVFTACAPDRHAGAHDAEPAQQDHAHAHGHDELPATDGPGYTAADVRFMQAMIGHHDQALTMAAMAASRGAGEHVMMLAERIDISQRDEIAMMQRWLAERGQAVPGEAHMHTMTMPGMVTPAQLAQLEAARGVVFDRLFLTFMIQHHEGAIDMVDALFASPGAAQDSDIFRFVTDVSADQADEIGAMAYMLELLDVTSRSQSR